MRSHIVLIHLRTHLIVQSVFIFNLLPFSFLEVELFMQKSMNTIEYRLGEILVAFGLISSVELEQGLRLSSLTGLPLGKTLIYLECIHDQLLHDLIQAQSMLREKIISVEEARSALNIVRVSNCKFQDALLSMGIQNLPTSSRLGELLSFAEKINDKHLKIGLSIADNSGLPLGQVLVMLDVISPGCLRVSLSLQRQLRAGEIEMSTAKDKLKSIRVADETVSNLPALNVEQKCFTNVSDLCKRAGIAFDGNMKSSKPHLLGMAVRLQLAINSRKISLEKAVNILQEAVKTSDESMFVFEDDCSVFSFQDFLRTANYLSFNKKREAMQLISEKPDLMSLIYKTLQSMYKKSLHPSDIFEESFNNDSLLRSVLCEIYSQDREYIESAFVYFTLVKSKKIGLCEAIMGFIMKSNGLEEDCLKIA